MAALSARGEQVILASLLLVFAVLALTQVFHASAVFEEPVIVATGYYKLRTADFSLDATHPALNYELAALPLLFAGVPFSFDSPDCAAGNFWQCSNAFFASVASSRDVHPLFVLARLSHVLAGMLLGMVVWLWTRDLYGRKAGMLAAFLYALSPTFISFSGLATQPIVLSLFMVFSTYCFWKFVRSPTMLRLFLAALAFALALATEYTAVLLLLLFVPYFFAQLFSAKKGVYAVLFPHRHRVIAAFLVAALFVLVILAVLLLIYRGQFSPLAEAVPPHYVERVSDAVYPHVPATRFVVEKLPLPFPSYMSGVAWQFIQTTGSFKANYFAGSIRYGSDVVGNLAYFAANALFKNPLPLLFFLAAGLAAFWKARKKLLRSGEWMLLAVPFLFSLFMLFSSRNEGPLHVLPAYAFLIIIASRAVWLLHRRALVRLGVAFLLAWYAVGTLLAAPHFIPYFNELLPEDSSYSLFSDHSNDMGQELRHLKSHMDKHGIETVHLSAFSSIDPALYGISYTYLPSPRFQPWIPHPVFAGDAPPENCAPVTGTVAISITNLNGVHLVNTSCYAWLRQHEPAAILGGVMLIYEIGD